ncbi:CaiB/BaiF CoA transferase family protein [Zwartia vadi]|uniref:CaiB/BaiF CoA transferase family protein n=1 Tax=Zwartia vadi TaxID=3058168 RepID=UPI0025B61A2F|nr:CoA transferase [Zwartia vadi]MDN3987248.1 CoA transferase [Zwartia vadi]
MTKHLTENAWLTPPQSNGSLAGVRVLDLSRVVAGPLCAQMLADHGADVIKVESAQGDETRRLGPPFIEPGQAAYFYALNRGKRGICLDLAEPSDKNILLELLAEADVLIENFLPGTMEKWGLGYESELTSQFPQLVYCSISGFGKAGPLGGRPGYDAVLQAMCGLMSINGDVNSGPTRIGIPIVDQVTGYTAFSGILMALLARQRTRRGQRVDATLFDTALSMLIPHGVNWMTSDTIPGLLGSAHPNIPTYDRFDVGDGQMFLGIVNDAQFVRFCKQINRPDLSEHPDFHTNSARMANRLALRQTLAEVLKDFSRSELCEALMSVGVPAGPVFNVAEAMQQPHAHAREMIIERSDYRGIGLPIKLSGTPGQAGRRPPRLGEHNPEIIK